MCTATYSRTLLVPKRAFDRRAVCAGVEAYEAAGPCVMRDPFEQDTGDDR